VTLARQSPKHKKPKNHRPWCDCSLCKPSATNACLCHTCRPPVQHKFFDDGPRARREQQPKVERGKTAPAAQASKPAPAPKKNGEVERTARAALALMEAKKKADRDPRAAKFLRLRAAGVPMHEALTRAENLNTENDDE